jgi:basic amino acid/polyamine antiporter, APA family
MEEQHPLLRRLGLLSATSLVVSNMIGTGIFITAGFLAGDLGRPSIILLGWIVGAVCALLGAICYSELSLNFPTSGGEYLFLSRAYGPTCGFITGWVSFFAGFSAPIAAAALSFASYVSFLLHHAQRPIEPSSKFILEDQQIIACGVIALFSIWNLFGIKGIARVQNVLTGLKVLLLIMFVVSAIVLGRGDWHNFSRTATRWTATPLWQQFPVSLFWIYVAYSGWNAATYVAEEIEAPKRTLPRALALGTGVVAILYVSLNITFLYATPLESMKGVAATGALAASYLFGPRAAGAFSVLMACALLSTVNAMIIAGPRVYYAMARNGQFFAFAAAVHPRWRTPVNAILAQAVCTLVLVLTPFPQLVIYIGFTLNVFAVLSVASLFRFRRQSSWQKLSTVSFAYPLIPCLFITVGMWMTLEGLLKKPLVSVMTVLTLVTGALLHRLHIQRSRSATGDSLDSTRRG